MSDICLCLTSLNMKISTMSIVSTFTQHDFRSPSCGNQSREDIKGIQVEKEVKLALFADDMVLSHRDKWMGKWWKQWETLFFGASKITADDDCSHEIKRCLLLGRKALINLDSHRTIKVSFHSKSQRKAMPKNAQTTAQLHSSHTLVKWCSKLSKPGFNNMGTMNFQMFKLVLEKAEEPEIKLSTTTGSLKKQESYKKTSISALSTIWKPLTECVTKNCGKFWRRWE